MATMESSIPMMRADVGGGGGGHSSSSSSSDTDGGSAYIYSYEMCHNFNKWTKKLSFLVTNFIGVNICL